MPRQPAAQTARGLAVVLALLLLLAAAPSAAQPSGMMGGGQGGDGQSGGGQLMGSSPGGSGGQMPGAGQPGQMLGGQQMSGDQSEMAKQMVSRQEAEALMKIRAGFTNGAEALPDWDGKPENVCRWSRVECYPSTSLVRAL